MLPLHFVALRNQIIVSTKPFLGDDSRAALRHSIWNWQNAALRTVLRTEREPGSWFKM